MSTFFGSLNLDFRKTVRKMRVQTAYTNRYVFRLLIAFMLLLAACGSSDAVDDAPANGEEQTPVEQSTTPDPTPAAPTEADSHGTPAYVLTPTPLPLPDADDEIPFMWMVTAPYGNTMYLFGTIHAATPDLYPLSSVIMDALHRSDYLAVEVWAPDFMPVDLFTYEDTRMINDENIDDLRPRVMAVLAEYKDYICDFLMWTDTSLDSIESAHPNIWLQVLTWLIVEKSELSRLHALDTYFIGQALHIGRMEILSIECIAETEKAFRGLSPQLHARLIENLLDIDQAVEHVEITYEAWRYGDVYAMRNLLSQDLDMIDDDTLAAEHYDMMFFQRGLRMTDMASYYLGQGKNVFYVVGAFHLTRENGVVDMLIQRGYDVVRIQ
ncbi:MAG: TraB/GumN family protein [Defluviitaleaceae bacterium]|nr:TraB/GumN family protein [Defluviitaleaceae bacterium]